MIGPSRHVLVRNNVVRNATSTSAGGNGYGVRVEQPGANNNWVHSNEITGDGPGADKGIRHGVILSWSADRNAVSNNTVRNTTWEGIDLHGLNEHRNEVRNNTVSDCAGGGIAIGNPGVAVKDDPSPNDSGPYNWVHHNEVSGCDTGISIELLSHRQFIEDNYLHNNKVGIGVYNQGALHLRLMRNRVQRNRIGVRLTAA
ncbi:MAG: right-handed parallel beta-helix repeat-containing protein, partial [Chloroflexia bacterium]